MARSIAPPLNSLAFGLILCIWLAGCATSSAPTVDQSRALSFDGLTPLENTKMTQVWVREGFSLGGYRKVMFSGAGIQYRPVASRPGVGLRTSADEFPLSEAQKKELENLITEEFDKALTRLTLEEVNAPGPDVLLVRGYMLDVVSRVPPDQAGRASYWLDSVGQATFVVELIDSQSNAVLVRALDTRAARTPGYTQESNAASNRAQVRLLLATWAGMLVDALNDLTALDEFAGA